jgi:hypothetical protein
MDSNGPFGDGAEIGVGFSDAAILVVSVLGFCFLASTIYSLILLKVQSREEFDKAEEEKLDYDELLDRADVATLNRAQRRARAKNIMKRQRRMAPVDGGNEQQEDAHEPHSEEDEPLVHNLTTRKERQRAAKVAELRERRLFDERRRQLQMDAQETAKKEKKERERIEAERAEQEKKVRLKDEQDYEAAQRRKYNTFLVSSNGETSMSVRDFSVRVEQSKVVSIDDLADQFQRPSAQVAERIQELVDACRLTGVIDGDRFIHISSDELTRMASFVMKQKQVTIQEVAKSTHTLVSL